MPSRRNTAPHKIRKQRIFPVIVGNLLLAVLLCACVAAWLSYYAVNKLQSTVDSTVAEMAAYTELIDQYLADGQQRVQGYAEVLAAADAAESPLPTLLAFSKIESGSDVGLIYPDGSYVSAQHVLSAAQASALYEKAQLQTGVLPLSDGSHGSVVFVAPVDLQDPDGALLYVADDAALQKIGSLQALGISDTFCILDENNRVVSCVGNQPEQFDYEALAQSGRLFIAPDGPNILKMLRDRTAAFELNLPDENGAEDMQPAELLEALRKTYVTTGAWFQNDLSVDGWKTVSYARLSMDAFSMRELFSITVLAALIILVPLISSVGKTASSIRNNRRIAQALLYDPVTGGNNFTYFAQSAAKLLKSRRYNGKVFSLVSLDVNRFRVFSEVHGHKEGEALLYQIFHYLQGNLDKHELISRYKVDEFALLLILSPAEDPVRRVEQLIKGLGKLYANDQITCSVGVYNVVDRSISIERMYSFATVAKDVARETHAAAPVLFDHSMRDELLREQQLASLMDKALKNGEFVVYLQPKYGAIDRRLAGAEALVRWDSPELGFLAPGSFIPIFEQNGFILKLDDYMLGEACRIQRAFLDCGNTPVPISVNVSRAHFADPDIAQHILDIVDSRSVPHAYIELELTESAFFDDKDALLNTVRLLRQNGFSVSMDDFGSGYSSLNSLKDLPLDIIKLDKAFFDTASDVERGTTLIRDTIRMAKNLDMQVVAEGIETREQVEFLSGVGCDLIQGFFFAKPMPVEEFEKL